MKNPKKTLFFLSVLLIGTVFALLCTACQEKEKEYAVKYEITGPATVAGFVMYESDTHVHNTRYDVNIPWSHTLTVSGKNIIIGCGAGFGTQNENTYTANIYVDGKLVKSSSSSYGVNAIYTIE